MDYTGFTVTQCKMRLRATCSEVNDYILGSRRPLWISGGAFSPTFAPICKTSDRKLHAVKYKKKHYHLRQGGFVFAFVCLSVCLTRGWLKNLRTNFDKCFEATGRVTNQQMIRVWWGCGLRCEYGNLNGIFFPTRDRAIVGILGDERCLDGGLRSPE